MGVIFVELWIGIFYCLVIDGNSLNQTAFPAKNICFFNNLRIALETVSTILGPLSVYLE